MFKSLDLNLSDHFFEQFIFSRFFFVAKLRVKVSAVQKSSREIKQCNKKANVKSKKNFFRTFFEKSLFFFNFENSKSSKGCVSTHDFWLVQHYIVVVELVVYTISYICESIAVCVIHTSTPLCSYEQCSLQWTQQFDS